MAEQVFPWTVPNDHPAFEGHFQAHPIVPGVVLLDRVILFAGDPTQRHACTWQVGNAKFLSPVGPGEALTFTLQRKANGTVSFAVRAATRDVASGSLTPLPLGPRVDEPG
jgi:3-hydroxymyristoyl/3-hydroxydecanoyl-(acyl carrier protein) dehydratase